VTVVVDEVVKEEGMRAADELDTVSLYEAQELALADVEPQSG
jgi:hypothetical protein